MGLRGAGRRVALSRLLLLCLCLKIRESFDLAFAGLWKTAPRAGRDLTGRGRIRGLLQLGALQEAQAQDAKQKIAADPDRLAFETAKFNVAWTKMEEAKERNSPDLPALQKEVEEAAKVVEALGGSKPAAMLTFEEAEKRAKLIREISLDSLLKMSNEERWLMAQGLGPAFPISLILAYTIYWTLNIPFIGYAYYNTVLNGTATMGLVMAGAYATSIPFKPLVYIGAILMTPWTAETVMPPLGKFFNLFRLPDESDWDRNAL
eukprot:TRINITY_DN80105_c0_g1_i1.p1 TRINITY_DN80105_c0_g1~~TRINITY_DN80105_c0_g1_i1.p1  ORF type:complete len:262 (+),score=74.46 TRINITY_DN80105_c0_g1_i1:59-844(+)